jgi:hypothetical protein
MMDMNRIQLVLPFMMAAMALLLAFDGLGEGKPQQKAENAVRYTPVAKAPSVTARGVTWCGGGEIHGKDAKIGGLSDMLAEGGNWLAVSDRGVLVEGTLLLSRPNGSLWLEEISDVTASPLGDAEGERLPMRARDSEGLAPALETREYWVSFEREHRLQRFRRDGDGWQATGEAVPVPLPEKGSAGNLGVEAIAYLGDGSWWLVAESAAYKDAGGKPQPETSSVWMFDGHGLAETRPYRLSEGFMPTAARRWDEMHLLVLERKLTLLEGFRSRLRLVELGREDVVGPVIEITAYIMHDNAESLAILPSKDGEKFVLIGSDDNYQLWQSSWLVGLCINDEAFDGAR